MAINVPTPGKGEKRGNGPLGKLPQPAPFFSNFLTIVILLLGFVYVYQTFESKQAAKQVPGYSFSNLVEDVKKERVDQIDVEGTSVTVTLKKGPGDTEAKKMTTKKEPELSLTDTLVKNGVTTEQLASFKYNLVEPSGLTAWLPTIASILFPTLLLIFVFWFISRQAKQGGAMQAFSFGQSKARVIYPDDTAQRVTFKDVAGAKEAKEELKEIVDFLREPERFLEIGAQIPKGVMLMGAPGTGKTLLARAVAGEAGVPFFHLSGSEFVEMFVGVGASRVRDLFRMVKRESPAIIFVDEIDAVGRARGTGMGGGNDEREQTLNQILVEMDGFEPTEKVIVMAATNRPDVLDSALLRPGRFDRRVTLELPDLADREEILGVHAKKKKLAEDVNLHTVAERTPGFSGADLYSLMNEAAILAAREDRKTVGQFDLIRSIEKVMIGPERRSHILSEEEKKVTAYHEGGHALVASLLPYADPVHKISIISRGHAAGYTLKLPTEERRFQTRREFLDDIAVALGGYVAEEMVFDDLTTGPSNDLAVATNIARDMVGKYGMTLAIGPVAFSQDGIPMLGRERGEMSENVAAKIDMEVQAIMRAQLERVRKLLSEYKGVLDSIALTLVDKETMEREVFEALLVENGIRPKKKHGEEPRLIAHDGIRAASTQVSVAIEKKSESVASPTSTAKLEMNASVMTPLSNPAEHCADPSCGEGVLPLFDRAHEAHVQHGAIERNVTLDTGKRSRKSS